MNLDKLLQNIKIISVLGNTEIDVTAVQFDSRKTTANSLFVATCGSAVDGHDFINIAIENGASAVVCEKMPAEKLPTVTYIQVENSSDALGKLASAWYDFPSSKLTLIGVTGTNGKTTIATLLYKLFGELGFKVGLLSTVCNYIDKKAVEATHTTPDSLALNELLANMVDAGCEYAFM
ncbi:MAG: Mur ligase family protein, partial [Paludibacter sp.]